MKRLLTVLCATSLWLGAAVGDAQAAFVTMAKWDFNDNNAGVDQILPTVTSTNFLSGGSLIGATFNLNAAARGWNPSGSAAAALAATDYWTFTITANLGYVFDLGSLSFDQFRQSSGPVAFQVFLGNTLTGAAGTATTSTASYSTDLSAYTGLTSATFYIVAWSAASNSTSANWVVDNVNLTGEVRQFNGGNQGSAVPEPTSMALAGFAGIGMAIGAIRRRRQSKAEAA